MPIVEEKIGDFLGAEEGVGVAALNDELLVDGPIQQAAAPDLVQLNYENRVTHGTIVTGVAENGMMIHLVICHGMEQGSQNNWDTAPQVIEATLNNLAKSYKDRHVAIVAMGTGETGRQQGANWPAIRAAIHRSKLNVVLYYRSEDEKEELASLEAPVADESAADIDPAIEVDSIGSGLDDPFADDSYRSVDEDVLEPVR